VGKSSICLLWHNYPHVKFLGLQLEKLRCDSSPKKNGEKSACNLNLDF
jgi:hypothetical protein